MKKLFATIVTLINLSVTLLMAINSAHAVLILEGLDNPKDLLVYNGKIFFSDNPPIDGVLKKADSNGANLVTLVTGAVLYDSGVYRGINSLSSDGTFIFGGYGGYQTYKISSIPIDGGGLVDIASISGGYILGMSGNFVYYGQGFNRIMRMQKDGSGKEQVSISNIWVREHAIDDGALYFVDFSTKDVKRFDINNFSLTTLISGNSTEGKIAIDSNYLYFASNGTIKKIPKTGGEIITIYNGTYIPNIVSDGPFLYFVDNFSIKMLSTADGSETILVDNANGITSLTYNNQFLYWSDVSGGQGFGKIHRIFVYNLRSDLDNDGVPNDGSDNCPYESNPNQYDRDGDGIGIVCDNFNDPDNDGIATADDNCPNVANPKQYDLDGDGAGLLCDNLDDPDNDGLTSGEDNCPNDPNPNQYDRDGDGIGIVCDNFDDNDSDGFPSVEDNCPNDANPLQIDLDGDNIGVVCDNNTVGDIDAVQKAIDSENREMSSRVRDIAFEVKTMQSRARYFLFEEMEIEARERAIVSEERAMIARERALNFDNDGDGYNENQGDCNDANFGIYPGATEICDDGIDQDCNYLDSVCP